VSFRAESLGFPYGLADASFELPAHGFVAIAGPNGAGKSTLAGILAGLKHPYKGSCQFLHRELRAWPRRELSRELSFLPQAQKMEFPFTSEEVAFMGRAPFAQGWHASPEDRAAVDRAMELTDTLMFRHRDVRSLSGGERQRVMIASALAQEPKALILDEPATFLDLKHQLMVYKLLAELGESILVVAVTHDVNLAMKYAHHVLVLNHGRLASEGPPEHAFRPDVVSQVFEVEAKLHASDGAVWMTFDA
jgi:iron complex transport system ATP-binding protein